MGLGAMYLKYRNKYRFGLRVAYYRDCVAKRILGTCPLVATDDDSAEVHILMWKGDWIEGIWSLKSLYHHAGIRHRLCIHEDGSLTADQVGILRRHFPNARVIDRAAANARMAPILANFPRSAAFRATNPLALKVYDFQAFLESDRLFLMDSDILFFSRPDELLRRIGNPSYARNTLNKDWKYGYGVDMDEVRPLLGFEFPELINSGLGLLHRGSVTPATVEKFLELPRILSHSHRGEQTLIGLCSAQWGFDMLPAEYDVHMGPTALGLPCRHYTGPIRHLMYGEGIPRLIRAGFLRDLGYSKSCVEEVVL